METKTRSTRKLLTLALAATVMAFGSVATHATVVSGSITGCLLINVANDQTAGQMQTTCGSSNLFASGTAAVDDTKTEFSFANAKAGWAIAADFGTDGSTSLTIRNTKTAAQNVIAGTHLLFSLNLAGDLDGFDNVMLTAVDSTGAPIAVNLSDFLDLPVNKGVMADGSTDWYDVSFNDAFTFAAGETVTLKATLRTVPEPGSLALLGAVVLAIGLASIVKRTRVFRVRSTGLAS